MPGTDAATVAVLVLDRVDDRLRGTRERISSAPGRELEIDLSPEPARPGFVWSIEHVLRFRQSDDVSMVRRPIELASLDAASGVVVHTWAEVAASEVRLAAALLPPGYKLGSSDPQPIHARAIDDRLAVYWAPTDAPITLRLTEFGGSVAKEARRWVRRAAGGANLAELPGIRRVAPASAPSRVGLWAAAGVLSLVAGALLYWWWRDSFPPADSAVEPYRRSYAVVIGIDDYPSAEWPDLEYAVSDARAIAALLRAQGFQVETLLDAAATKRDILAHLEDDLAPRLEREDRVLVYFGGHGFTQQLGGEQRGYIVPHDGQDPSSYISMEKLRELSGKMGDAKHQLFLMDACFGGLITAGSDSGDDTRSGDVADALRHTARQVLTAGGAGELVSDARGEGFTANLLNGIRQGLADENRDGQITVSELASFVIPNAGNKYQTPVYATLAGHDGGDFVFRNSVADRHYYVTPEAAAILLRGDLARSDPQQTAPPRFRGALYSRVAPAVAFVRSGVTGGHASGFLVDERTVVTNHHVIADHWSVSEDLDAPGLFVDLYFGEMVDGQMKPCHEEPVRGYIAAVDSVQDLALLELEGMPAGCPMPAPLQLADYDADSETQCAMIGHPLGAIAWSFRRGDVMSRGMSPIDLADTLATRLSLSGSQKDDFLDDLEKTSTQGIVMTTLLSNPGDSGAPLVDLEGHVIGVTCGISGGKFAYHIEARHLRSLLDDRSSGRLGSGRSYIPDAYHFVFTHRAQVRLVKPQAQITDHGSLPVILSFPNDAADEPDRVLLDLDADTPEGPFYDGHFGKLLADRQFDAEVAVHRLGRRSLVFYDTDDSPGMDTILVYERGGNASVASYRFFLNPDGTWGVDREPGNPWLDPAPIEEGLRDVFSELARELKLESDP